MKRSMLLILLLFAGLYVILSLGGDSIGSEDTSYAEMYEDGYSYDYNIGFLVN